MTMIKGKSFLYLTCIVVVGIIFGNLFSSWVFFVGAISTLSIFVISTRTIPPKKIDIDIKRGEEDDVREVYVDDDMEISLTIENHGQDIQFLEIHDELPSLVEVIEGSNHQILSLKKGETREISYKISCPVTGSLEIGPIKLRYRDAFQFYSKELEAEELISLRVLPDTKDMNKVDIHPSYTKHWLGDIKSKSIGVGSEFFSLREYHPGDEMRDINWKATARHFNPYTNEYEGEMSGDVILVVDCYKDGMIGKRRNNTMKASIDAASSLASAILAARNRVGLIVSGEYLNWLYPGTGKNHYHRIMENLTRFERGGTWGLEGVKWILEEFFPRKSMIIFISPLTIPEFSETIIDFCRREYDVMVVSPNPIAIEAGIFEDQEKTVEKLCLTEREITLNKIWKYGSIIIDWDPNEPLEPALEEVLRYRKKL